MADLAFVGLGAMGSRLAKRLLDAGYTVTGYNRTAEKARALVDSGMKLATTPREAAAAADVVFTMVTDNDALRAVSYGADGVLAGLRGGATLVEMSTVGPDVTRELGEAIAARGAIMLDAPVSGSTVSVEQGVASIQVGGDAAALERVRPYLAVMGPNGITHVGPLGIAKAMKVATNLGVAVQILAFCEAVALAEKSGITREAAVEALMRSVIASPLVKYRGPFVLGKMAEHVSFPVPMIQKDLQLALDQARAVGVPLPLTALTQEWMTKARAMGLGDYDFAVVFDVFAAMSGLPPAPKNV
ncbi:MAG TPA: NAD(P)-dependent oxidoreductase [Methylomirabilota bacterium]|jgi:3-hydroxyisobutyrate dehydrogenase-like beta-hydroxyacid dehydrogenase|nr:NAD(P)-dependent oxidoreductase [Methylomirabilota bacterium]